LTKVSNIASCSNKGPSIKNVRSQGGGGLLSSADILRTRGFIKCGRPHFLAQKTSNFSELMVCPHGQGELSQCGHFADTGSIFRDFVGTFFMDRPYKQKCLNHSYNYGVVLCCPALTGGCDIDASVRLWSLETWVCFP